MIKSVFVKTIACLTLLIMGAIFAGSASASTLKLDPKTDSIESGKDLIVNIILTGNDELIDGIDAIVSYDVEYLELKEIKNGTFFGNYPIKSDNNGQVQVTALAPKDGVKIFGDITVATLTFEILDSGDTKLDFVYEKDSTKDSNVPLHSTSNDTLTAVTGGEYAVVASPENLQRAQARRPSGGISPGIIFIILLILIAIALWYWWRHRKPKVDVYTPEPFPMDRPPDLG